MFNFFSKVNLKNIEEKQKELSIKNFPSVHIYKENVLIFLILFKLKDYQTVNSLKDHFAYFNNQSFLEIRKSLDDKCISYITNIKCYSEFKKKQILKVSN